MLLQQKLKTEFAEPNLSHILVSPKVVNAFQLTMSAFISLEWDCDKIVESETRNIPEIM